MISQMTVKENLYLAPPIHLTPTAPCINQSSRSRRSGLGLLGRWGLLGRRLLLRRSILLGTCGGLLGFRRRRSLGLSHTASLGLVESSLFLHELLVTQVDKVGKMSDMAYRCLAGLACVGLCLSGGGLLGSSRLLSGGGCGLLGGRSLLGSILLHGLLLLREKISTDIIEQLGLTDRTFGAAALGLGAAFFSAFGTAFFSVLGEVAFFSAAFFSVGLASLTGPEGPERNASVPCTR